MKAIEMFLGNWMSYFFLPFIFPFRQNLSHDNSFDSFAKKVVNLVYACCYFDKKENIRGIFV